MELVLADRKKTKFLAQRELVKRQLKTEASLTQVIVFLRVSTCELTFYLVLQHIAKVSTTHIVVYYDILVGIDKTLSFFMRSCWLSWLTLDQHILYKNS